MNPLKKLAGQTAIYGLSTTLPRFLNYLLVPFLTYKFANPADFGINTEIYAYISFLNILVTYGLETAFFYFSNKTDDKNTVYSTALISIISSTLFFTLLGIICKQSIANLINQPEKVTFVFWMILIVASDALMAIPFVRLRAEQKALHYAGIKMANIFINIFLTVFFIHFCQKAYVEEPQSFLASLYNPEIGIGYAFLANVIANLASLLLLGKQFTGFAYKFDFALWKNMMVYSMPLLLLGFGAMINETFDRIILKKLLPADRGEFELGVYGACYKISIVMTMFTQAFKQAAEPFFFSNIKNEDSKKMNAIVMKYFIIACSFLFLACMMNISWIKYFVGEKYREGLGVVPILLLANLFLGIYYNLSIWYKLTGQTKFGMYITFVGAALTLGINFALVPLFGYYASAWATFISYGVMMVLSYNMGQKHYPIKYSNRSFVFFFGGAVFLYLISLIYSKPINEQTWEVIPNNILLLFYCYLFYKFELPNLKKLKNAS